MWIADVFGRERGEQIDLEDIALLFHRTREMDVLERPENHVILGAKGSGKSTALRALTWRTWRSRAPSAPLPFVGVYLPMDYGAVQPFCLAYNERQSAELFEHFFVSSLLMELCVQLKGTSFADKEFPGLLRPYIKPQLHERVVDLAGIAEIFMEDRQAAMRSIRKTTAATLGLASLNAVEFLTIHTVTELAEKLSLLRLRLPEIPPKLAILLDSFDYYGLLGRRVAPLLQSDMGAPLLVKVAARTLDVREVFSFSDTRPLERGRDYQVSSLDREADDQEHLRLVRDALCRRARALGPEGTKPLTDENIVDILFGDSRGDPNDLASFESFVRLSSGNVLAVILLLADAARLQREKAKSAPQGLGPLQRQHRLRAVQTASDVFWSSEIGVRVPHYKHEATVFCEVSLEIAKAKLTNLSEAPSYVLPSMSAENQPLVSSMLASRILTATEAEINTRAQCNEEVAGPVVFELNRTLLPKYGLFPSRGSRVELEPGQFGRKYREALKAQKPFLSPRSTHSQQELFRAADFNVFVSLPFDRAKRARSQVLRNAINRLYREKTGRSGGERLSYTDIHCIPPVGAFRYDIPQYVRDATYVVADISELGLGPERTPGVFYEIGLAVAHRKPLAFFYNWRDDDDVPAFNPDRLPTILRGQTVLVWGKQSASFIDEFTRVHEKLSAYLGSYDQPLDGRAGEALPKQDGGHAYLSFLPRNRLAEEWFVKLIRELFPELRIDKSQNWQADDAPLLTELVSTAAIRIVDCTGGVNSQALELGIAAATGSRRTVEVWDVNVDRRLNPVAMFPGARYAWTDLGTEDKQQISTILQNVARSTPLGTVRP